MILNGGENISQKKLMGKSWCRSVRNSPGIDNFSFGINDVGVRGFEGAKGIDGLEVRVLEFHELHIRVEGAEALNFGLVGCGAGTGRTGKDHDRCWSVRVVDMGQRGRNGR